MIEANSAMWQGAIPQRTTNERILALLDQSPPKGYGRWAGPLLAEPLNDVGIQYVWRFLRTQKNRPRWTQILVREQRP